MVKHILQGNHILSPALVISVAFLAAVIHTSSCSTSNAVAVGSALGQTLASPAVVTETRSTTPHRSKKIHITVEIREKVGCLVGYPRSQLSLRIVEQVKDQKPQTLVIREDLSPRFHMEAKIAPTAQYQAHLVHFPSQKILDTLPVKSHRSEALLGLSPGCRS